MCPFSICCLVNTASSRFFGYRVLNNDPYNAGCLPLHVAVLVELQLTNGKTGCLPLHVAVLVELQLTNGKTGCLPLHVAVLVELQLTNGKTGCLPHCMSRSL